jgi:hypothetical protein
VKNGIPYDVAMSLDGMQSAAYSIIYSEFNLPQEQHFDFKRMKFREPAHAKKF